MRKFRRLEIEAVSSDAFGLGSNCSTTIRALADDQFECKSGGIAQTQMVFDWLKAYYFGFGALRKLMLLDHIEQLKDKDLAELLKRVLADGRDGVGNAPQGQIHRNSR